MPNPVKYKYAFLKMKRKGNIRTHWVCACVCIHTHCVVYKCIRCCHTALITYKIVWRLTHDSCLTQVNANKSISYSFTRDTNQRAKIV